MIILGIVLLIAGFLLKISILWTLGIVLLVIGAILAILGSTGRAVAGRPTVVCACNMSHRLRVPRITLTMAVGGS